MADEVKIRHELLIVLFVLFAAIVFGLIWFFFLSPSGTADLGNFGWYLFSFTAGLTMIVLPCTLPLAFVIVPLSMGKGVLKGFLVAIAFGLGIAITLSLYGVAAAALGKVAIGSLGAPLEVVKNWLYFVAGAFAYVFALGELGLVGFRMPTYSGALPGFIQKQRDLLKALLLGLFLGNIGVGCPHPATPVILTQIAASGDIFYGWSLFFVHAIGRVLPLIFLAVLGILGVNALSVLVKHKEKIERATGWGMVFVAGFILILGLFSHDWWVLSGQHTFLESLTQEHAFIGVISGKINVYVPHTHGMPPADHTGLFGLPLAWGTWVLLFLWILPFFWYYRKRKNAATAMADSPEKNTEKQILPYVFWNIVSLSLILILVFGYILPHRFAEEAAAQEAGHMQMGGAAPSAAVETPARAAYLSGSDAINSLLKDVLSAQHVDSVSAIDCSKIPAKQMVAIGDGVMDALTGDETHHSAMENMMGGEDSAMTISVHTRWAEVYLGCPREKNGMMNMSGAGMSGAENDAMDILGIGRSAKVGEHFTDMRGFTLYTYANDTPGVSNCTDADCTSEWPPYAVKQPPEKISTLYKDLGVVKRNDGSYQYAWKGSPLYFDDEDKVPGDANGDVSTNIHQIARPFGNIPAEGMSMHGPSTYGEEDSINSGLIVRLAPTVDAQVGRETKFVFTAQTLPGKIPVTDLAIEHEKYMHVIGVRDDMNEFFHIHPQPATDKAGKPIPGRWEVAYIFQKPGRYKIWTDVSWHGATYSFGHPDFTVSGSGTTSDKKVDFADTATVSEKYRVSLSYDSALAKGEDSHLNVAVKDLLGQNVDLDQYLGTTMHLTAIKDNLRVYIHTHPGEDMHMTGGAFMDNLISKAYAHGGESPALEEHLTTFHVTFPEAGVYGVFAQFRPKGSNLPADEALTASFYVKVAADKTPVVSAAADWWRNLLVSIILIAILSRFVKKYITVQAPGAKNNK